MYDPRYLTTEQVANRCGVCARTVKQWYERGELKGFRTPRGHHRFHEDDFARFAQEKGFNEVINGQSGYISVAGLPIRVQLTKEEALLWAARLVAAADPLQEKWPSVLRAALEGV